MRILVHDHSGHPFQAQLSRELSHRGHQVTHSYCAAYRSGKGRLRAEPGEALRFVAIGEGITILKMRFRRRLLQELRFGWQLIGLVRRVRPQSVLVANVPLPTLIVLAAFLRARAIPWVLWHQDVQSIAMHSFAGNKLSQLFRVVAWLAGVTEKWCCRRATSIVVIAQSFVDVHRVWGTAAKTTVIPNWAPLDEIYPVDRKNDWAVEHRVDSVHTLLYSGTLGLKHNPSLLVQLARRVIDTGRQVHLVVVNEGPAEPVLREEAERLGVPMTLLPFQPYERLSEVLGSGDVLVVLLEQDAGGFSVPSKTLSYLCAGRPVLGLMPSENLAAQLIASVDGCVLAPAAESLDEAVAWINALLDDPGRSADLGARARALAEREFSLPASADRFEAVLQAAATADRPRAFRQATLR